MDYMKSLAIIGVLLFHVGIMTNGYLGVEIFFTISGFLFAKSHRDSIQRGEFKPFSFVAKRLLTFWPMVLVASAVALVIGYFVMLPDDYENLAESVIASDFFANNVLQAITIKNYWAVVNTYKPLMHTWYIGVLLQIYVFVAFVLWGCRKILKRDKSKLILVMITLMSLLLYFLPIITASDKFYYFQYRLYEFTAGALIVYLPCENLDKTKGKLLGSIALFSNVFILFCGYSIPNLLAVPIVTVLTCVVLATHTQTNEDYGIGEKAYSILSLPGKHSYDIYIWHQLIIAFSYYAVFQTVCIQLVLVVIVLTVVMSILSSILMNKLKAHLSMILKFLINTAVTAVLCGISMLLYLHAGVVRDVPELDIDMNNVHRNMHAEYCDIPYSWDNDFRDQSKKHILVFGDSFGRDFANILNESDYSELLEISYIYGYDCSSEMDRVNEADLIFFGFNGWNLPDTIKDLPKDKLYIVGNKGYGNSNGIIYAKRFSKDYFDQTVVMKDEDILNNNALKGIYGNRYIDMMGPVLTDNRISVFTDDNFYISQDCKHLTQKGAQFYSRILDLSMLSQE
ncbi:acyltransferase family protein [Lachnobacterium bovis]|uniref:acyltransferase family protein n=1 Tax=Lachnobacterium bovis TaxID=140626 RepID=UPI002418B7D0|nr:acyltransferase [Lachnobacterium bovis]